LLGWPPHLAVCRAEQKREGGRILVYKDAPHAFHADYRPSYRKAAAEDGFQRTIAWFKTHGVA
jgi:carboxymethylenebutenolidase